MPIETPTSEKIIAVMDRLSECSREGSTLPASECERQMQILAECLEPIRQLENQSTQTPIYEPILP